MANVETPFEPHVIEGGEGRERGDDDDRFHTTEDLIEEFKRGRMVILVDDESRENEGDLILPAELVEPHHINFMARYARGLICLPMSAERCDQLDLPLMESDNREAHRTAFTVSIDAAAGTTTGISAADRAKTIRTAVQPDAKPSDFVRPGHVFPLRAVAGGVLTRAGHTEAGCDLARLAGFQPAAVIVEIMNEDGSMARRPELELFAREHQIKIGTIADLIQYRMHHERTVERVADCALPTRFGKFRLVTFRDRITNGVHFALVRGEISATEPTLIRVHVRDALSDLTGSQRDESRWPIQDVLARIDEEGAGVVVILRNPEPDEEIIRRVKRYQREDEGEILAARDPSPTLRTYGVGAQILLDLGVRRMRVLSKPRRMLGLSGFGMEVVEYVY
ncbi:MAG: 3,4-dihydroxy-2-butanone-4-phosphate synthase [Gammaproteobacteria bacterium]|nr:3,4-dihydroxy-2-butanone-4-phosphate synthase [Gammaproteobacteria bacterium]